MYFTYITRNNAKYEIETQVETWINEEYNSDISYFWLKREHYTL